MKEEKRFKGLVGLNLYYRYFKSGNIFYFLLCLFIIAVSVGVRILSDYWLAAWAKDEFSLKDSTYIWVLWMLLGISVILIFLRGFTYGHFNSIISIRIFKNFIQNLFRKSMQFFDSTSIG